MKPHRLISFMSRPRPHTGADLRRSPREEGASRFAGLGIRGRYHIVTLHNFSAEGACVEMPIEPRLGERVKITSGTLNRVGRLVWVDGTRGGIEFE
jgi:hypothetical protein